MTEKSIKNRKNKNNHLKLKKSNVQQQPPQQQKVFESDSDISELDDGIAPPKMDHRALNQISSEVTDLLATLKKEHGIDDDDDHDKLTELTTKSSSTKKDKKKLDKSNKIKQQKPDANAGNVLTSEVKTIKLEDKMSKQQMKSKKMNANKKAKSTFLTGDIGLEIDGDVKDKVIKTQEGSPKKKKKNKKRPASVAAISAPTDDKDDNDDDMNAIPPASKKKKKTANQEKKPNVMNKSEKKQTSNGEEVDSQKEADVKKDYYLKNAVPVYVGNLPTNIKRLKLVKLFKKFGKILSIRFRTNSGGKFFKKSMVKNAPYLIAFIYFETREEAEASLACNGTKIGDNVITVDLDGQKRVEDNHPQKNTVVVGNLKYSVTTEILRDTFKCCGQIEHIRTLQGIKGCKGIAFICFTKPESSELALKLNGTKVLDREIRVERYSEKKKKKQQQMKNSQEKTSKQPKIGKVKKMATKGVEHVQSNADGGINKKKYKPKTAKEFMGAKSADNKKISNQKKKTKMNAEKRLAKKVAPKSKKAPST